MTRRQKKESEAGAVDDGEGRGVPLGGRDNRLPTRYQGDDEVIGTDDRLADYEEFSDHGDSQPDDRRRDPLRR